jgi:hypothetical protein
MLGSGRTVISVPAHDLREGDIPGSLFDAAQLQQLLLPEDLRRAFELVAAGCKKPLCMTRPEMFTHGVARRWLDDRLGSVRNHICLSDGSAVKVIDGLENHVFFFRSEQHKQGAALRNLLAWAPEVFAQLRSQINSFHGAMLNDRLIVPPPSLLFPKRERSGAIPEFLEFFVNSHSGPEGARHIITKGAVPAPKLNDFSDVYYIPFTESGAHDPAFSKMLAQKIAAAYFNPSQCLLIRLPALHDNVPGRLHQLSVALEAVRGRGIVMPKVPAPNILLLTHDIPENFFNTHQDHVSILFDSSFDFWRYTQAFYQRLRSVTYWLGNDRGSSKTVIQGFTKLLGRPPTGPRTVTAATPVALQWIQSRSVPGGKHGR